MNYYRRLAFELRRKGLEKRAVASVLEDVRDDAVDSGISPDVGFGRPRDAAKRYPDGPRISGGQWLLYSAVLLALAQVAVTIVITKAHGLDPETGPLRWTWTVAAFVCIGGVIGGRLVDRRLPRSFTRAGAASFTTREGT